VLRGDNCLLPDVEQHGCCTRPCARGCHGYRKAHKFERCGRLVRISQQRTLAFSRSRLLNLPAEQSRTIEARFGTMLPCSTVVKTQNTCTTKFVVLFIVCHCRLAACCKFRLHAHNNRTTRVATMVQIAKSSNSSNRLPKAGHLCSINKAMLLKNSDTPWASCHAMENHDLCQHVTCKLWGLVHAALARVPGLPWKQQSA
jgi:hypothetical protein